MRRAVFISLALLLSAAVIPPAVIAAAKGSVHNISNYTVDLMILRARPQRPVKDDLESKGTFELPGGTEVVYGTIPTRARKKCTARIAASEHDRLTFVATADGGTCMFRKS